MSANVDTLMSPKVDTLMSADIEANVWLCKPDVR